MLNELADQGYKKTLSKNKNYLSGLNVFKGKVTFRGVADAFKLDYYSPEEVISQ